LVKKKNIGILEEFVFHSSRKRKTLQRKRDRVGRNAIAIWKETSKNEEGEPKKTSSRVRAGTNIAGVLTLPAQQDGGTPKMINRRHFPRAKNLNGIIV